MQMSDEAKAQFRATSEREETIYKALSISPETGELIFPSGLDFDETPNAFAFLTASGSRVDVSSRFRALAGRAVLDAHQSRLDH